MTITSHQFVAYYLDIPELWLALLNLDRTAQKPHIQNNTTMNINQQNSLKSQ